MSPVPHSDQDSQSVTKSATDRYRAWPGEALRLRAKESTGNRCRCARPLGAIL